MYDFSMSVHFEDDLFVGEIVEYVCVVLSKKICEVLLYKSQARSLHGVNHQYSANFHIAVLIHTH